MAVDDADAGLAQTSATATGGGDDRVDELFAVASQQRTRSIDRGQNAARHRGGLSGVKHLVEARQVDVFAAHQHERSLRIARQSFVGRGHDDVGTLGQRVVRQRRVKTKVRGPSGIDHQRNAVLVRNLRQARNVRHGAHITWLTDEHGFGIWMLRQSLGQTRTRQILRQSRLGVDFWAHPDWHNAGVDQAYEHRLVQSSRNDDFVAGTSHCHHGCVV